MIYVLYTYFFKDFIYLFLERGEGRQKERDRNINVWLPLARPLLGTSPATQACALTGNQTSDPLLHSPVLNPLSHTSQGSSLYFSVFYTINVNYVAIRKTFKFKDLSKEILFSN